MRKAPPRGPFPCGSPRWGLDVGEAPLGPQSLIEVQLTLTVLQLFLRNEIAHPFNWTSKLASQ
jgi:hypothetical protein